MSNLRIKKQVCTLEQARKIHEIFKKAGIDAPESCFSWIPRYIGESISGYYIQLTEKIKFEASHNIINNSLKAYTCAELGVLLPADINGLPELQFYKNQRGTHKNKVEFYCGYGELAGKISSVEAHSRADFAIKGLTEGFIEPEDFKYEIRK